VSTIMKKVIQLTEEQIEAGRSPKGGWTRKQLAEWGVPWPPPKGWRRALTVNRAVREIRQVENISEHYIKKRTKEYFENIFPMAKYWYEDRSRS